jgi:type VI secretion system FHA domain protein
MADAFWTALGLDPARVPPQLQTELLAECGRALREAVGGLVPVLSARRSLKDELRMDQTRLKPKENNPLKFLPSGEAVLQALIDRKLTGFLPLAQAIREGFGDIKAHEVASLVALDAVIRNLLARFDPASMETPGSSGKFFGRGPDKTKLWDNFVRVHTTLSGNLEETTRRLVGEEFARAYAQQVDAARHGGD